MSTRLVILGLLRDRQLYGYEIKLLIEDHMADWTNIAFGSIYFAIQKLAEEGSIEKVGTEREGKRPSRSVYRITPAGRKEFLRQLRQVWGEYDRQFFPFDVGLFFMDALPREEIIDHLRRRIGHVEGVLEYLDEHQAEQTAKGDVPALAQAIFDHTRLHLKAEHAWTHQVLSQVEAGAYP